MNHRGLGTCVQVNHRNGLLRFIRFFAELHAVAAVHHKEVAALAAVPQPIRAAQHVHGHGADGGEARRGVHHQNARWRDRAAFSRGFLLALGNPAKKKCRQQKSHRKSQCHEFTLANLEYSLPHRIAFGSKCTCNRA